MEKLLIWTLLIGIFQDLVSSKSCKYDDLEATDNPQKLKSPHYPSPFPAQTQCTWTINARPGNRVKISFMFFDLLQPTSNGACEVQSLVLHNGLKEADNPGQSFILCGKKNPGTMVSQGHILRITLHSDAAAVSGSFKGFMINYISTLDAAKMPSLQTAADSNHRIVNLGSWLATKESYGTERVTSKTPPSIQQPWETLKSTLQPNKNTAGGGRKRGAPLPTAGRFIPSRQRNINVSPSTALASEKPVKQGKKEVEGDGGNLSSIIIAVVIILLFLLIFIIIAVKRWIQNRQRATEKQIKKAPGLQPKPQQFTTVNVNTIQLPTTQNQQINNNTNTLESSSSEERQYTGAGSQQRLHPHSNRSRPPPIPPKIPSTMSHGNSRTRTKRSRSYREVQRRSSEHRHSSHIRRSTHRYHPHHHV